MSKLQTVFECQHCTAEYIKWQGHCDTCNNWNSLEEKKYTKRQPHLSQVTQEKSHPIILKDNQRPQEENISTTQSK